jgi:soluble cytochrome b562
MTNEFPGKYECAVIAAPMSDAALVSLREDLRMMPRLRSVEVVDVRQLIARMDKQGADLEEAQAKLAELREMERERNDWRHGFERLLGRCIGGVCVTRSTGDIEAALDASSKAIERLRRKASLAGEVLALSRAYEKKAP